MSSMANARHKAFAIPAHTLLTLIFYYMKRFLFSLLTLVVTVVCGFSVSAQDWSTTVKWEIPGSIQIMKGTAFASATAVDIPADATEVTLTEATGYFVIAADGYALVSADLDGTAKTIGLVDYSSGIKGVSIRAQYNGDKTAYNGKTLTVGVVKLEYKPFNLEVANGASGLVFKFYNNGSEVSTISGIADGSNALQFPNTADQLYVQTSAFPRTALYSVQLEGAEQTEANTLQHYYLVPLTEGCNIYVAKDNPGTAKNVDVTFKFANNNPNIVATIRDWNANKFIYPEEFGAAGYKLTLPAGSDISFNWNTEATITSLTQNGENVSTDGATRLTVSEDTEFVITGSMTEYAEKTVQLYLVNPDNARFTANGENLALTFVKDVAANSVTLSSGYTIPIDCKLYEAKVLDKPNAGVSFDIDYGYWVKEAIRGTLAGSYASQEDIPMAGVSKIDLENMPLFLNVAQINYSATAHIFYDGPESSAMLQSTTADGDFASFQGERSVATGWSEIKFDPEYNSIFTARINVNEENQSWVKTVVLDGTALKADENGNYNMPYSGTDTGNEDGKNISNGAIVGNSVLKMFLTPVAAPAYYTTLEVVGSANATVTYDKCKVVDLTETTRLTNYGPTPFEIRPGANVIVKVNGDINAPDEEGVISLILSEKTTITFEENNQTIDIDLSPVPGSTVRKLNKFSFGVPFDGEHMIWFNEENLSEITLTSEGGEPIAAQSIEPGASSDTDINIQILFPTITEAGKYTLHIPAGFFYQTVWSDESEDYVFQPGCQVTKELTADYTLDPSLPLAYTFDPADGSANEFPSEGQFIIIRVDDADTFEAAETTENGPWVKFNGVDVKKVEDPESEIGWGWIQTWATWGQPALSMYINQAVFSTVGTLEITADENAFIVDGEQASSALSYSAQFGEKKNYNMVFSPEAGSSVPNVNPEFKITFEEAASVAVDENNFDAYFRQGLSIGMQILPQMITIDGNTVTIKIENDAENPFAVGNYILEIMAGSLIIDGNQPNDVINVPYVIERKSEVSQEWTPTPSVGVINYGYNIDVAFLFGEEESVAAGAEFNRIKVSFDGTDLVPYSPSLDDQTMWYRVVFEPSMPNAVLISTGGGKLSEATTSGSLTVTIPAGALDISGTPLAKQAEYTWKVLPQREYTVETDPENGAMVKDLSSITVTFPDAESASLSEYFNNGNIALKKGYAVVSNAKSVTKVDGAEHPSFLVEFETPVTESGDYTVTIYGGAFILDDVFESDYISLTYHVDPTLTGVDSIFTTDGRFTVVSTQGIVILRDADAEAVRSLPAGLYIINNRKVNIR